MAQVLHGSVTTTETIRAKFALPLVEGCLADPLFSAHLGRLDTELLLLQYSDNLLFGKPFAFRHLVLLKGPDSSSTWIKLRGQGHGGPDSKILFIFPF
jgi:hypothetical protein